MSSDETAASLADPWPTTGQDTGLHHAATWNRICQQPAGAWDGAFPKPPGKGSADALTQGHLRP